MSEGGHCLASAAQSGGGQAVTAPAFDAAARRRLILALTFDVRRAHRKTEHGPAVRAEVRALIDAADGAGMDERGTQVFVARWQADIGARAWAGVAAFQRAFQRGEVGQ